MVLVMPVRVSRRCIVSSFNRTQRNVTECFFLLSLEVSFYVIHRTSTVSTSELPVSQSGIGVLNAMQDPFRTGSVLCTVEKCFLEW